MSSAEKLTSLERRLDTAAWPRQGVRRSWLTADSSDRRRLSAFSMAWALLASSGEFLLADPACGLFGDGGQYPQVSGGQTVAGHEHPEFVVAHFDDGVGGVDAVRRILARACHQLRVVVAHPHQADRTLGVGPHGPSPAVHRSARGAPNPKTASAVQLPAMPSLPRGCLEALSTSAATAIAVASRTTSVTALSGSAMVNVCLGSVR